MAFDLVVLMVLGLVELSVVWLVGVMADMKVDL